MVNFFKRPVSERRLTTILATKVIPANINKAKLELKITSAIGKKCQGKVHGGIQKTVEAVH